MGGDRQQPTSSIGSCMPQRRPLQWRKSNVPGGTGRRRKPPNYWKDVRNIERELRRQWEVAVTPTDNGGDDGDDVSPEVPSSADALLRTLLPPNRPPPIPNEALLRHWDRHDLGQAIRQVGRAHLAEKLWLLMTMDDYDGGIGVLADADAAASIDDLVVPGKWKEAVRLPLVRHVVEADVRLSMERAPPSSQQVKRLREMYNMTDRAIEEWTERGRWRHYPRNGTIYVGKQAGRREMGYWSKKTAVRTLYVHIPKTL